MPISRRLRTLAMKDSATIFRSTKDNVATDVSAILPYLHGGIRDMPRRYRGVEKGDVAGAIRSVRGAFRLVRREGKVVAEVRIKGIAEELQTNVSHIEGAGGRIILTDGRKIGPY